MRDYKYYLTTINIVSKLFFFVYKFVEIIFKYDGFFTKLDALLFKLAAPHIEAAAFLTAWRGREPIPDYRPDNSVDFF
ncbi:MAG: hypothetical protein KAW12_22990 [Candidatus Aminicenantes bacterium]|nr:hypothetical protein [Candidatus Aminicenantes bacterium]